MQDLESIKQYLRKFAKDREWEQFHSPKNLAMALSVEAAELVEIFQWLNPEQAANLNAKQQAAAADEIADVLLYLVRIADRLDIDIAHAVTQKMRKNEQKYPADLVRGSAKKYSEY
ncbi:MAG: nucleotide pyrophosphohydrolase [Cellvibrionaceae bacterium]|nr:nucleotide pyrophosphohydrolase [Cellvibrionaceae bacterium]